MSKPDAPQPRHHRVSETSQTSDTGAQETHTGTVLRAVSGFFDVRPDAPSSLPGATPGEGAGEPLIVRCRLRERLRKDLVLTESTSRAQRVREVRRLDVVEPVVAGDRVRLLVCPHLRHDPPGGRHRGGAAPAPRADPPGGDRRRRPRGPDDRGQPRPGAAGLRRRRALPRRSGLIDRFLVSCEYAALPAMLVINKADLGVAEILDHDLAVYERAGYPVLLTSAATGDGVDTLRQHRARPDQRVRRPLRRGQEHPPQHPRAGPRPARGRGQRRHRQGAPHHPLRAADPPRTGAATSPIPPASASWPCGRSRTTSSTSSSPSSAPTSGAAASATAPTSKTTAAPLKRQWPGARSTSAAT